LYAQLEQLESISQRRRDIYDFYYHHLAPLEKSGWLQLPSIPDECESNYHMFYALLPNTEVRDALIANLKEDGIAAPFHYVPLHTAPVGMSFGYRAGDLPVTEDLSSRLVRLPFYYDLCEIEQMEIVSRIRAFAIRGIVRRAAA
jgi:dTDP-4-amino-4,6-dideoxygalactose transaminase